jgi:hypothetical protein
VQSFFQQDADFRRFFKAKAGESTRSLSVGELNEGKGRISGKNENDRDIFIKKITNNQHVVEKT